MKKHPAKTQGKMKMTKMKSCIFSKIWKEISLKNISFQKFFFFEKKLFSRNLLQILENPKNFMISFFHPLNLNRNLFLLKKIPLLPEKDQANSEELF